MGDIESKPCPHCGQNNEIYNRHQTHVTLKKGWKAGIDGKYKAKCDHCSGKYTLI